MRNQHIRDILDTVCTEIPLPDTIEISPGITKVPNSVTLWENLRHAGCCDQAYPVLDELGSLPCLDRSSIEVVVSLGHSCPEFLQNLRRDAGIVYQGLPAGELGRRDLRTKVSRLPSWW